MRRITEMNSRENLTTRKYKLFVVWRLLDDHISVKEHEFVLNNALNPQLRDIDEGIKNLYPFLNRNIYSLYCRYEGIKFYPILDHLTLMTALKLMDAYESPLLYLVRKDWGIIPEPSPGSMQNPNDIEMILKACPETRWVTDYKCGKPEHLPLEDDSAEASGKSRKSRGSKSSETAGSGKRKSMKRGSMKRGSMKRGSMKRGSVKRGSMKRGSVKRGSMKKRGSVKRGSVKK